MQFREIPLVDEASGEAHRADLFCDTADGSKITIELQHSPISEEERNARERFYLQRGRMFWLLHLHNEQSMRGWTFSVSLGSGGPLHEWRGKNWIPTVWVSRSTQFIEQWKRSKAHVFFDYEGKLFYLATGRACAELLQQMKPGFFAVAPLSVEEFHRAVMGIKS